MLSITAGLKNSLLVLEHLRNNEDLTNSCEISVGTFTNCRENGLTFAILGFYDDNGKHVIGSMDKAFTYCVYEHRNSDEIIINGKSGYISMNGDLPYNEETKYDYIASFRFDQHMKCAQKLADLMLESRKKFLKSKKIETAIV